MQFDNKPKSKKYFNILSRYLIFLLLSGGRYFLTFLRLSRIYFGPLNVTKVIMKRRPAEPTKAYLWSYRLGCKWKSLNSNWGCFDNIQLFTYLGCSKHFRKKYRPSEVDYIKKLWATYDARLADGWQMAYFARLPDVDCYFKYAHHSTRPKKGWKVIKVNSFMLTLRTMCNDY